MRIDWFNVFASIFVIALCAILVGSVLFLVVSVTPQFQQWRCDQFASVNNHLEIKYVFPVGCLVKTPNGTWVGSEFVNQYAPVNVEVK